MKVWFEHTEGVCIVATQYFTNLQSPLSTNDTAKLLDGIADRVRMGVWEFSGCRSRFERLFEDSSEFVGNVNDHDALEDFTDIEKGVIHALVLEEVAEAARDAFSWKSRLPLIDDGAIITRVIAEVQGRLFKNAEVAA